MSYLIMSTMILSEEFNKKQSEEEFGIQRNKNYKTKCLLLTIFLDRILDRII